MNIVITDTYEEMSKKAANIIVSQVTLNPESVLGLATGSTPIKT
jgi:glucosamine-6-phosphate deaminase